MNEYEEILARKTSPLFADMIKDDINSGQTSNDGSILTK